MNVRYPNLRLFLEASARVTCRIIQFGTSCFLQAHVDLFVHEARLDGQDIGPIAVVQASSSGDRQNRVAAFGRQEGYPVVIRGIVNGALVEHSVTVQSVDRGLSAVNDWEILKEMFAGEAEIIVSNMGDSWPPRRDGRPEPSADFGGRANVVSRQADGPASSSLEPGRQAADRAPLRTHQP